MKIYAIAYAQFIDLGDKGEGLMIDDAKVFTDKKEANKCRKHYRRKMKMGKEDQLLRVITIEVHEKFKPELYEKPKEKENNSS